MSESSEQIVPVKDESAIQNKQDDESTTNVSTQLQLEDSVDDRLANLTIVDKSEQNDTKLELNLDSSLASNGDKLPGEQSDPDKLNGDQHEQPEEPDHLNSSSAKPEKSPELTRSILLGEISDNSECSVEVDGDDDESSERLAGAKPDSNGVSDEEMFIEDHDQDEDVEEEEEFHEFEEERHKTSQESVDDSRPPMTIAQRLMDAANKAMLAQENFKGNPTSLNSKPQVLDKVYHETERENKSSSISGQKGDSTKNEPINTSDWANIMLSNSQYSGSEANTPDLTNSKDEQSSETQLELPNADPLQSNGETQHTGDAPKTSETDEQKTEPSTKQLDHDEDVKNPQYIPKKGVFYEHDDRSHDIEDSKQLSSSATKKDHESSESKELTNSKKSSNQDKQNENKRTGRRQRTEIDRWNHDLFRDDKQKPKSKSELVNAYGYDIRQERSTRNQTESRTFKGNTERQQQGPQDTQRSRPNRDGRPPRQPQSTNRSRERKPRRPNNTNGTFNSRNRTDTSLGTPSKRDNPNNNRTLRTEPIKDPKQDLVDSQQVLNNAQIQPGRRDNSDGFARDKNPRGDNRNRRQNSRDRPKTNIGEMDNKPHPITTVMPPITTWSNKIEDMVKEEANSKELSRHHQQIQTHLNVNVAKPRQNDSWPVNYQNKPTHQDRPVRNPEEIRHQPQYNSSRRNYQDRDETQYRQTQFINRNHYNDRSSSQHNPEWRRTNNFAGTLNKTNEPIKTQTFENSRLSQNNMNRGMMRDGRDLINERRMQSQQIYHHAKAQANLKATADQHHTMQPSQQRHMNLQQLLMQQPQHRNQQMHQHQIPSQHSHQQIHNLQQPQLAHHMRQQQQQPSPASQLAPASSGQESQQPHANNQTPQQVPSSRHPQAHQQHSNQPRTGAVLSNPGAVDSEEPQRMTAGINSSANAELINGRPIIKTDTCTGTNIAAHSQHSQPIQQHSQNHRSMGGSLSQQGPNSAPSHLLPSHLNAAGTQAQYYTPPTNSRDSVAAAALASAYHGYIPSGHSVMDTSRYHMTSQQMSDHSYMSSPGQADDVAAASAMHQSGLYTDATSAGGTVASSAYLAQAGSSLSPSTNIPVTGAGPPHPPLHPYLQQSQYATPPYSNPYSQPQHNQAPPPQSAHGYPYWTYI